MIIKSISQDNVNSAITGGVLGGLTLPAFSAVIAGAIIGVLSVYILKAVTNENQ